jgi:hypothetical protein
MTLPIIKHLYRRYSYDAVRRNKEFNLSIEVFESLISCPCHYCNKAPAQVYCQKSAGYKVDTLIYNGVDRVDNSLGYVNGNVVPCCASCNQSKKDRSAEYRIGRLQELGQMCFSKA